MSNAAAKETFKGVDDLLKVNEVVKDKWTVQRKIGGGGFGEIYEVQDVHTQYRYAMKVESAAKDKQVLKMEVAVLRKLAECPFACQFIGCGRCPKFSFVVMTLQGPSLSELRRKQENATFSERTMLRLGKQMLSALHHLHKVGFLHRDVKPSNFAMGCTASTKRTCFMLDFGLSRQYLDSDGCIRPPRPNAGFRGTVRYASLNAHHMKEMGRHDDLWSLFYVMAEFRIGGLPWRKVKDKDVVGEIKAKFDHTKLLERGHMPKEFLKFLRHLGTLSYEKEPDYKLLFQLIDQVIERSGISDGDPYDWEQSSADASITQTSTQNAVVDNHEETNHVHAHLSISPGEIAAQSQNTPALVSKPTRTFLTAVEHPAVSTTHKSRSRLAESQLKSAQRTLTDQFAHTNYQNGYLRASGRLPNNQRKMVSDEIGSLREEVGEDSPLSESAKLNLVKKEYGYSSSAKEFVAEHKQVIGGRCEEKMSSSNRDNADSHYSSSFCSESNSPSTKNPDVKIKKPQNSADENIHERLNQKQAVAVKAVDLIRTPGRSTPGELEGSKASGSDNVFLKDGEGPFSPGVHSPWQLKNFCPVPQASPSDVKSRLDSQPSAPVIPRPPPGRPTVKCVSARRKRFVRSSTGVPFSVGSTSSKL